MSFPFFTIITATYNAASTLPRLLDSLAAQTCHDFELIIQDGGSSDETMAVAESYRDHLPALSLTSEPDSGIYDAWNKALGRINGQWVLFLGADDRLAAPDVLEYARNLMEGLPPEVIFVSGDVRVVNAGGDTREIQKGLDIGARDVLRSGGSAQHSGLFQRADIFRDNFFDLSYRICGDHDLICRLWTHDNRGQRLGFVVTAMGFGGVTSRISAVLRFRWEKARVVGRHYGPLAVLPMVPGMVKGVVPHLLVKLWGEEKAARAHDAARRVLGSGDAWDSNRSGKE